MTSAHSMFVRRWRRRTRTGSLLAVLFLSACHTEKLASPVTLASPYDRPQLWAIAPFNNESGVSIVKTDRIADIFVEQAEGIDGIAAVPVNRVLTAMQRLNMRGIGTPHDALTLMNVLGVDGLIVGTVTAYDPYPPLKLGAAVQLYRRGSSESMAVDPYRITRSTTESVSGSLSKSANSSINPVAQASAVFDAGNHEVLMWLDEYSTGRSEPGSAFGKRIYLASMEMYTQFVAYRLLHDLLAVERATLPPPATPVN